MTTIRILFVFGRIVVAIICYSSKYFKSLFSTALVATQTCVICTRTYCFTVVMQSYSLHHSLCKFGNIWCELPGFIWVWWS